jgi:hypothetical protein
MEPDYARGGRHPKIVEGDGSKDKPFVVNSNNPVGSAIIQKNVVTLVAGLQTEHLSTARMYYESPRGQPGNGDLCEHQIKVDDEIISIWFDLYLVTKQAKEAGVPQNPVAFTRKFDEVVRGFVSEKPKRPTTNQGDWSWTPETAKIRAGLSGAMLGITIAAWVLVALGAIVLANRTWYPGWWWSLEWCAGGWILLGWVWRFTRAHGAFVAGAIFVAIVFVFGGPHAAGVMLVLMLIGGYHERQERQEAWTQERIAALERGEVALERSKRRPAPMPLTDEERGLCREFRAFACLLALLGAWVWWSVSPHEFVPPEAQADPPPGLDVSHPDQTNTHTGLIDAPAVSEPTPPPAGTHWIRTRAEYDALPGGSLYQYVHADGSYATDGKGVDLFWKGASDDYFILYPWRTE